MMKFITKFTVILMLLFSSFITFSADNAHTVNESSAIELVKSYMAALMAGDTSQISQLISPKMLEQRQALFNNPDYPTQLQNAYANATYEIIASEVLATGNTQIDVKIELKQLDVMHSRFVVAKINGQFQIVVEQ